MLDSAGGIVNSPVLPRKTTMESGASRQSTTDRNALIGGLPSEEWQLLRRLHPNVLLTGTPPATAAAVNALRPSLRSPVITWHAGEPLVLPPDGSSRTLILDDAVALSFRDQLRLLAWLKESEDPTQVVTTAPCPLLPLVDRGVFLEALYYHLNLVYIEILS